MALRRKMILYIVLVLLIVIFIIVIWAIDTGRIGIQASETTSIDLITNLKEIPSPDNSTFAKIFTFVLKPFYK